MEFLKSASQTDVGSVLFSGAMVNFYLVILGSALGLFLKRGFSEKIKTALMTGMALCVLYIGVTGILEEGTHVLVVILSLAVGAVIGEWIDLDGRVKTLAILLDRSINRRDKKTPIADGFVAATLLFCVGAMTVVGSIDSGILGDNTTLYSKSVIDGIAAVTLASTYGFGVLLSALPVLVIEGGLTLLAVWVAPVLSDAFVTHTSVIGSLLIIALSLNMLKITEIKVMNYVPAMLMPLLFCSLL